jgi:hypothetical protein
MSIEELKACLGVTDETLKLRLGPLGDVLCFGSGTLGSGA